MWAVLDPRLRERDNNGDFHLLVEPQAHDHS